MPSYVRGRKRRALDDAEIIRLYIEEHLDSESIAFAAQCSSTTVLDIVRAAGHPVRRPGRGAPRHRHVSDEEIIQRYRAGQDGPRLAAIAGCTPGTIYRLLRRHNVPVRPPPNLTRTDRRRAKPDPADG